MSDEGDRKVEVLDERSRAESTTDRVTMAEAARLKGVSYHTVSRAVRRGKLPVLRLGRMALISMADLQAWQPMKERAPRKYRRKQRSVPGGDPLSLIEVDHLELVRRVATFYELIATIANEGSLSELAEVVTARISEALHLERASLWQFDLDAGVARRLGVYHANVLDLPDEVAIDLAGLLRAFAANPHATIVGKPDTSLLKISAGDVNLSDAMPGPVMVAPMVYQDRQIGVILGDRAGKPLEFSEEMLDLADVIATQVAIAVDNVMRRNLDTRRRLQLESIIDDLNGAVSAIDHRGRLTYFTNAELELFDLREGEVWVGQPMADFISRKRRLSLSGQEISIDDNPMARALRGERLQDLRQIVVRKNGEQRYVSTSARPVFVNGELAGAVTVTRDVTAERAAEQRDRRYLEQLEHALRRSQMIADIVVEINETRSSLDVDVMSKFAIDRVAEEFDAVTGSLWILGSDHRFHLTATHGASDASRELGYMPEEFALASAALTRNKPVLVEIDAFGEPELVVKSDDELTHVLIIPMRIRGQRTGVAYLGFKDFPVLDQSDEIFASVWGRQCAQAIDTALLFHQIESAHGRLVAVIDQLPQAVVIVDGESRTVSVANQAADELWGRHVEDGTNVRELRFLNSEGAPLDGSQHPLIRPMLTREQIVSEPLLIPQADGAPVEVLANHAPIMDLRKTVVGSVSVLQKRSDFKSLDRAKDEFISVVAHELRNPLTSLRGNLQLLQRRMRKRDDAEVGAELQRVDTAMQQVDRVADLVSRMLDVSRVDMGSLDVSPGETDAVSLINEAVNAAIAIEPTREFRIDAPSAMPVVWDAARINQVLNNLMQNAERYAPGTLVEITLEETVRDLIRIRVRDHGPGVPETIRRRLFKQYYRFDDGQDDSSRMSTDGSRGLGIGLYISARLARAHHGSLSVDNAPDGGAVFTLELPRDASQPEG
jgi:excisionase family DNA binding protein/PAS domain S-box-containing protein